MLVIALELKLVKACQETLRSCPVYMPPPLLSDQHVANLVPEYRRNDPHLTDQLHRH